MVDEQDKLTPDPHSDDGSEHGEVAEQTQDTPEPDNGGDAEAVESEQAETQPVRTKPAKSGRGIASLALLLSAGALGGTGYNWYSNQQTVANLATPVEIPDFSSQINRESAALSTRIDGLGEDVNRALSSVERQTSELGRMAGSKDSIEKSLQSMQDTTRRQISGLEKRFQVIEGGVATLADMQAGAVKAMGVAETEFLLRLANERMQLFSDPLSAIRALRLADAQLRALEDPVYTSVRQTLAGEIQALDSIELPDRVSISGRLLTLAEASPEWPLDSRRALSEGSENLLDHAEDSDPDQAAGWWQKTRANMQRAAAKVATVHKIEATDPVLISLDQELLLRENVRLQLQVAQLSAVRGEQDLYGKSIAAVEGWINQYYATDAKAVADALAALDELGRQDLQPKIPDISKSLRQLRNMRAAVELSEAEADSQPAPAATGETQP